jgi:hypothetical protein
MSMVKDKLDADSVVYDEQFPPITQPISRNVVDSSNSMGTKA